jgi:hypothetical protein
MSQLALVFNVKDPGTGLPMAKSLAVSPVDVDNDGWMDLTVANDTVQNFLFHNEHNGTFKEIGARSGIAYDAYGWFVEPWELIQHAFATTIRWHCIGNFANEMNALYVQRDSLVFADEALQEGVDLPVKSFLNLDFSSSTTIWTVGRTS